MNNPAFTCPCCMNKISIKELFTFKREHITVCQNCGSKLRPLKVKSWNWGFFFGFLGVVIPSYIIIFIYNNYTLAFIFGIVTGIIAILCVAHHTYKNTFFEVIN